MPAHFSFLKKRGFQVVTVVLFLQAIASYSITRKENTPLMPPLEQFPQEFGEWKLADQGVLEKEVETILRPDDYLIRSYVTNDWRRAGLFIAYFRSQRTGQYPHSPKNCLPGSGWVSYASEMLPIAIPGQTEPIVVNRYRVAKGDEKSVVLYWYQTWNRVVASEYRARVYLIGDSIRFNRTDTALVRIVVPITGGDDARSDQAATDFAMAVFPLVKAQIPMR